MIQSRVLDFLECPMRVVEGFFSREPSRSTCRTCKPFLSIVIFFLKADFRNKDTLI